MFQQFSLRFNTNMLIWTLAFKKIHTDSSVFIKTSIFRNFANCQIIRRWSIWKIEERHYLQPRLAFPDFPNTDITLFVDLLSTACVSGETTFTSIWRSITCDFICGCMQISTQVTITCVFRVIREHRRTTCC